MTTVAPSIFLERLNPFVGRWETEGEMKIGGPGKAARFRATDIYEWLPGRHFLLHRFDADMPEGKIQGIEVIGYNEESDSYSMRSYDSTGNTGLMQAQVALARWTFVGETLRFAGGFRDRERVFAGLWESRAPEDTLWQPLMEVSLRKVE